MTRRCEVPLCKYETSKTSGNSVFKFPTKVKYNNTLVHWLNFCRLKVSDLDENSGICSGHFADICFNFNSSRTTLKPGSIPTIYSKEVCTKNNSFSEEIFTPPHPKYKSLYFSDIMKYCSDKLNSWPVFSFKVLPDSSILLYILESTSPFNNIFSINIKIDKSVQFFSSGREIDRKKE